MFVYIFGYGFVGLAVWAMSWLVKQEKQRPTQNARKPFTEHLLRPPGESLREKLDEIQDELLGVMMKFLIACVVPIVLMIPMPFVNRRENQWIMMGLLFVGLTPWFVIIWRKTRVILREKARYSLGYSGERAVGEELNQLLADGCRVYHDVVFEEKPGNSFNIDHVVVSPTGVYAIETKARRKPLDIKPKECVVRYDGKTAMLPSGENAHGLEQAAWNSQHLSKWLTSAVGEAVNARPVLTFPGWYVTATGRGEVSVLNPKMIRGLVLPGKYGTPLSESLFKRINHQMEQKSRNLEL